MEEKITKRERKKLNKLEKVEEREVERRKGKLAKYLLLAVLVAVVFWGTSRLWKWINTPIDDAGGVEVASVVEGDWVKGSDSASNIIIEYGDFQCPACASYAPILSQLAASSEDVKIVYRHFPLVNIHKNAIPSAKAAEAAGKQGKFWEMHDMLYSKQTEWSEAGNARELFEGYANDLGLDIEKFKTDFASTEIEEIVNTEYAQALQLRLNSTPSFFVNGQLTRLPQSVDSINDQLNKGI